MRPPRSSARVRRSLAAASLVLCSGCSLFFHPPRTSTDGFQAVPAAESERLGGLLAESGSSIHTLRASYSSILRKHIESQSARQVVVFEHPDQLRVEVFVSGLNRLGALITSTGRQLQALFPDDRALYIGAPSAQNLARLLSAPLDVEQTMYWFAGRFPPGLTGLTISRHEAKRNFLLEGRDSGGRCIRGITIDPPGPVSTVLSADTMRLQEIEMTDCRSHDLQFRAEFFYGEAAPPECPEQIPAEMKIWLPSQSVRGTLRAERLACNVDLSARRTQLFHPHIPSGVEVHPLDDSLERLPNFEGRAATPGVPSRVE